MTPSLVIVVGFHLKISASGRSIVQRIPTECDVPECDHESSIMRRPCPIGGAVSW